MSDTNQTTLGQDEAYELLSNARRRFVISYLRSQDGRVPLNELSQSLAAWENDIPVDEAGRPANKAHLRLAVPDPSPEARGSGTNRVRQREQYPRNPSGGRPARRVPSDRWLGEVELAARVRCARRTRTAGVPLVEPYAVGPGVDGATRRDHHRRVRRRLDRAPDFQTELAYELRPQNDQSALSTTTGSARSATRGERR